uniref:Uncharacterized protein n=1 Tax=Grammatophora oceanica TaxID=210454 RepID=A0A7S1US47_9STRA
MSRFESTKRVETLSSSFPREASKVSVGPPRIEPDRGRLSPKDGSLSLDGCRTPYSWLGSFVSKLGSPRAFTTVVGSVDERLARSILLFPLKQRQQALKV